MSNQRQFRPRDLFLGQLWNPVPTLCSHLARAAAPSSRMGPIAASLASAVRSEAE